MSVDHNIELITEKAELDRLADEWWELWQNCLGASPFHSPAWEGRTGDRAYVCQNYTCQLPAEDVDSFVSQISHGYST